MWLKQKRNIWIIRKQHKNHHTYLTTEFPHSVVLLFYTNRKISYNNVEFFFGHTIVYGGLLTLESNKGTVREMTIYSRSLNEEIELIIYYPATYSPLYKYNILIAQDGRDYFNLGRIARVADKLLHNHEIENTIIVGIPYKNKIDRWNKYHPDGTKHSAYIRFLGEEIVPYLDQNFPTYQMGLGRILIGDSLAASVSLLASLEYPHTFGKVIMQSPYVNDYILEKVQSFQEPHLVELYHIIGKEETAVDTTNGSIENFIDPNREMNRCITQKGFSYFYDEFDGDHKWTYWQPDIPRALSLMLKNE